MTKSKGRPRSPCAPNMVQFRPLFPGLRHFEKNGTRHFFRSAAILKVLVRPNWFSNLSEPWVKESRHVNFGAIHAIFLQLSCSQHKFIRHTSGISGGFRQLRIYDSAVMANFGTFVMRPKEDTARDKLIPRKLVRQSRGDTKDEDVICHHSAHCRQILSIKTPLSSPSNSRIIWHVAAVACVCVKRMRFVYVCVTSDRTISNMATWPLRPRHDVNLLRGGRVSTNWHIRAREEVKGQMEL